MTATFASLRDTRLPKAVKAVRLLGNLATYDHDERDAKELVNALNDAFTHVDTRFARKWEWTYDDPAPAPAPLPADLARKAKGGATVDAEVRWAIDAIRRGDTKLAQARLANILAPA